MRYCHRRAILFQTFGVWFVNAEWLFLEIVAGGRISAGPAAHADIAELAAAALAFQVVDIAQFVEDYRVFPDFGKRLLF